MRALPHLRILTLKKIIEKNLKISSTTIPYKSKEAQLEFIQTKTKAH
jgi:hypothetical protein